LALSRITIAALLVAGSAPAQAAEPLTAEQALANYRSMFKSTADLDCPPSQDGEIIVCAQRGEDQNRLPPPEREPGVRIRGEAPSGTDALNANRCISSCQGSVSINLLAIPGFIAKVVERLKDK
jgi:hypothetical protein